jgi:hypothetical protein
MPNCGTHGLHGAQPNEPRVFRGDAFNAQLVFNCFALPKFNTGPSKCTAAPRTDRALSMPCVTNSVAVDGEPNARSGPSISEKFRKCGAFWTKANCTADNFNGFQKCAHLCGLTFELSGRQRHSAWPARRMMYHCASRAKRYAVGSPLERLVRPHSCATMH